MLSEGIVSELKKSYLKREDEDKLVCIQQELTPFDLTTLISTRSDFQCYFSFSGESVYCAGDVRRITMEKGDDPFRLRDKYRKYLSQLQIIDVDKPQFLRFYGGFSFNDHIGEEWSAFQRALFILPAVSFNKVGEGMWLTLVIDPTLTFDETIDLVQNITSETSGEPAKQNIITQVEYPVSHAKWEEIVNEAKQMEAREELEKVVLSRICQLETEWLLSYPAVIRDLERKYNGCYIFLFQPDTHSAFFGASPELLFKKEHNLLHSFALAGTIGRGKTELEDEKLSTALIQDEKEGTEHQIVVDQIVHNLKEITTSMEISGREVLKLSNVQHLKTEIRAKLAGQNDPIDILLRLHPTPALGGYPKDKALDFITSHEPHSRGWYGSPIGWINHQNDSIFIVGIRSALNRGKITYIYAGAGIVEASDPDQEWQETELKFQPMLEAMNAKI